MPTATTTLNGKATHHSDNVATTMSQPNDTNGGNAVASAATPKPTWRDNLRQRRDMALELVATTDSAVTTIALHAGLVIVICVNFVLSFAGIYDYAHHTMNYGVLSPLAPIGIDGLTICAIAGMYRMRNAHWRIRAFTWFVYLVPTACSIGMNIGHATQHGNDNIGAVASAATWPTLLSLAIHLSVVVSRHTERAKHVAKNRHTPKPERQSESKTTTATPAMSRHSDTNPSDSKTYARQRVAGGATIGDILTEMKLEGDRAARKRFERWTADLRRTQK